MREGCCRNVQESWDKEISFSWEIIFGCSILRLVLDAHCFWISCAYLWWSVGPVPGGNQASTFEDGCPVDVFDVPWRLRSKLLFLLSVRSSKRRSFGWFGSGFLQLGEMWIPFANGHSGQYFHLLHWAFCLWCLAPRFFFWLNTSYKAFLFFVGLQFAIKFTTADAWYIFVCFLIHLQRF